MYRREQKGCRVDMLPEDLWTLFVSTLYWSPTMVFYQFFSPVEQTVVIRDENLSIHRDYVVCPNPNIGQEQDIYQARDSHSFSMKLVREREIFEILFLFNKS